MLNNWVKLFKNISYINKYNIFERFKYLVLHKRRQYNVADKYKKKKYKLYTAHTITHCLKCMLCKYD